MLDDIKNNIPKMEKGDCELIYNNLIERQSSKKKISFNSKIIYTFASLVVLLAICIPVGIKLAQPGSGNNVQPEIITPDITDVNQGIVLGDNLANLKYVDSFYEDGKDVLTIYLCDLKIDEVYIKSANSDNKIVDVKMIDYDSSVTLGNSIYTINLENLKDAYINIYFEEGTFENNLIYSEDDKNFNDKDHASQKINVTVIKYMISVFGAYLEYEEVEYGVNFDLIK